MILVDPSDPARRFFNFGAGDGNSLDSLPHVLATVTDAAGMDRVVKRLTAEYDDKIRARLADAEESRSTPVDNSARTIFVIFDHYDDVDLLNGSGLGTLDLAEVGKGKNIGFVIAGSMDITRDSSDKLRRRAESARYTLVLNDVEAVRYMGVRGLSIPDKELPPGRGYLVKAVTADQTQICLPFIEAVNGAGPDAQLSKIIGEIRKKYASGRGGATTPAILLHWKRRWAWRRPSRLKNHNRPTCRNRSRPRPRRRKPNWSSSWPNKPK